MFCLVIYRSLFVLLSFFFWPLCCLSFDLRILMTSFGIFKPSLHYSDYAYITGYIIKNTKKYLTLIIYFFKFCYEIISELNYLFTFNTIDRRGKKHRNVMFTTESNLKYFFYVRRMFMYFWMKHSITSQRFSTNYKPFILTKMVSPCLRCIFLASW